ncbi:F5/8 type C domain protein [Novosphingobium sp. Rr 2-17]|uniref:alpha-L-fucosidase n=1 Tax=Novosphingobium sp. Rr 2-17 TaxID=555793 RepID=UPI000269821A|nr:alpha-L-fucosidase [Novosphingobium sp. Rr 2-17]EIZ78372.1 F5/8 type C domain protein [Novosphingobium sp. Rr 2-17]
MPTLSRRTVLAGGLASVGASVSTAAPLRRMADLAGKANAPTPWGATPSARQLAWHRREQYAFIHFSINTFTDREWGYGDETPRLFDPTDFSADQIVGAAKAGGLRGIVLTAKHHDGFCLWPTMLTEHCVRNSPFRQGKGDIVREFEQAARRAGMAFGIYLSPWDRNHAEYGRPGYIDYYRKQVVELCTRYGPLFEFWFDGANGGDGYYGGARETRKIDAEAYYNWPSIFELVHQHQPMACTFEPLGSDIRWVGNEDGVAGDPCWPTMPNHKPSQAEGNAGLRGGPLWWPAETNTSIRPGWFYHADEDSMVKDPRRLLRLYDESVARGTNLILNLPPDRRGRLADPDVAVLQSFGKAQRATFAANLAHGAIASAEYERGTAFTAAKVLDRNPESYWSTPDAIRSADLVLEVPPGRAFDLIRVREYLPLGVRVSRFAIDLDLGKGWQEAARGECIGAQRIVRLPRVVAAKRLRLRILDAMACPAISEIALFRQVAPDPVALPPARQSEALSSDGWSIVSATGPGAEALLDNNPGTAWVVPVAGAEQFATVTIGLGKREEIGGFTLTPSRAVMNDASPPKRFRAETSLDGRTWSERAAGEFSNIANALTPQRIPFPVKAQAAYVRFTFQGLAASAGNMAIADVGLYR